MAAPLRIPPSLGHCPDIRCQSRRWPCRDRAGAVLVSVAALLFAGAALPQDAPAAPSPAISVHITAPQPLSGRGEWTPPESEQGFLSTTPIVCTAVVGEADASRQAPDAAHERHGRKTLTDREELSAESGEADPEMGKSSPLIADASRLRWRVTVFRSGRRVGTITGSGSPFTFRPADASRRRASGPLAVEIIAVLDSGPPIDDGAPAAHNPNTEIQSPKSIDRVWLQQDEIDQIRQEYLDLPGRQLDLVPRHAFIDRASYERAGVLSIPWPELNRTRRRDGGAYGYILFTDALRDGLRKWKELLGSRGLAINSGFRNPFKQCLTNGSHGREGARGSMHQYGRAVDVCASLRQDFRDWVQVAWAALDAGADYVETAPEGGWSHVHADWRHDGHGPPLTVKLEIAGRVLDAEGQPVPAARVLGSSDAVAGTSGMPAWEGPDEEGRFVLRTIWRPGRPYRLRAQAEQGSATRLVTVPEGATGLVHLETELDLSPEALRVALARRSFRLSSRGGRSSWRRRRFSPRRHRTG